MAGIPHSCVQLQCVLIFPTGRPTNICGWGFHVCPLPDARNIAVGHVRTMSCTLNLISLLELPLTIVVSNGPQRRYVFKEYTKVPIFTIPTYLSTYLHDIQSGRNMELKNQIPGPPCIPLSISPAPEAQRASKG